MISAQSRMNRPQKQIISENCGNRRCERGSGSQAITLTLSNTRAVPGGLANVPKELDARLPQLILRSSNR